METVMRRDVKTTEPDRVLAISVYYSKGGMSYFTGAQERRGYWLSVTPQKIEKTDTPNIVFRVSTAFTGTRALILETARKSSKAQAQALAIAPSREQELIAHVCAKNGLTVAGAAI